MADVHEGVLPREDLMAQLQARLDSIEAWLLALTGLEVAQLLVLVAMVLMLARRCPTPELATPAPSQVRSTGGSPETSTNPPL